MIISVLILILGIILGIAIIFGGFLFMVNHHDHTFSIIVTTAFLLYCLGYVLYLID